MNIKHIRRQIKDQYIEYLFIIILDNIYLKYMFYQYTSILLLEFDGKGLFKLIAFYEKKLES